MDNTIINVRFMGLVFTPEHIKSMREWVSDCEWLEDIEDINELSDLAIVNGVQRHYDGGLKAFLTDANFAIISA